MRTVTLKIIVLSMCALLLATGNVKAQESSSIENREESTLNVLTLTLTAIIEGFWNGTTMVADNVTVELHNSTTPYALVDSKTNVALNTSGAGTATFNTAVDGTPYFIVVKHRNSIETWSKTAQVFTGGNLSYNFTTAATQAFGDNLKLKGGKYCIFSGDTNQDGLVDLTDEIAVINATNAFTTGYVVTDLSGDNSVDLTDEIIVINNTNAFVSRQKP